MKPYLEIGPRRIGAGEPTYIIAEMSGNHGQDFSTAGQILRAAKEAGADGSLKVGGWDSSTLPLGLTVPSDQHGAAPEQGGRSSPTGTYPRGDHDRAN